MYILSDVTNHNPPKALSTDVDPLCPSCDYNLRDLQQARCPECGAAFTWDAAHAHAHEQRAFHFEFQARRRPVRSYLQTTAASLRPTRFWNAFPVGLPPRPASLALQLLVTIILGGGVLFLARHLLMCIEFSYTMNAWVFPAPRIDRSLPILFEQFMPLLIFVAFYCGCLLLGNWGGRIWKSNTGFLLRVLGYAFMSMLLYAVLATVFSKSLGFVEDYFFIGLQAIHPEFLSTYAALIAFTLHVRYGLARQLEVKRTWMVSLAALIASVFAIHLLIYLSATLSGSYDWSSNVVIRWFTHVMDPYWILY